MNFMTEKDWNEVDRTSREEFVCFLSCQLSASDIYESVGNCSFDVSAIVKHSRIGVEIKDRNCDLSTYGDMMVTDYKYNCNMRRLGKQFDKFIIVSFYKDNKMALAEIRDKDMRVQEKYCNYTTLIKGESNGKVRKTCYIYPQRIKLEKKVNKWRKI